MVDDMYLDEEDFCEECGLRLELCECDELDEGCPLCGKHGLECECDLEYEDEDFCPVCGRDSFACRCDKWSDFDDEDDDGEY